MANILDSNTDATVGPAPTSGSGTMLDYYRSTDIGKVSDVDPQDAAAIARGAKPPKLNSFEKAMAFQRAADNAAQAAAAGQSAEQAAQTAAAASQKVRSAPMKEARPEEVKPTYQPAHVTTTDFADLHKEALADARKIMEYKGGVDLGDMMGAAWREMSVTGAFVAAGLDQITGQKDFKADPLFDSLAGREQWGMGLSQEDLEWVADSSSADERQWRLGRLNEQKENYRIMGAHGEGLGTIAGLSAGFLDPAGWAAGMGVGKVAQMARVGTQLAAVTRGMAEGVAGNVLSTAAMQAAGDHVTPGDYFYAAAFGAAFGTVGGTLSRRAQGIPTDPTVEAHTATAEAMANTHMEGALQFSAGLMEEAQRKAGPNAGPEEIAAAAHEVYQARFNEYTRQGVSPMADYERLLPDVTFEDLYGAPREAVTPQPRDGTGHAADDLSPYERNQLRENGITDEQLMTMTTEEALKGLSPTLNGTLTKKVEANFADVKMRDAIGKQYGITPETVPDNARRLVMQEILFRTSEQSPAFDEAKLNTLIGKWIAPLADSKMVAKFSMPQHILARAEHPVLRWVAANLLESPTQNAGPRTTAAVEHTLRQRDYDSYIARYNEAYRAWRNQNGGSEIRDAFSRQDHFDRFNDLVKEARDNRSMGIMGDEHPHVKAAADALDEGYAHLGKDQVTAKTLGSENLPASSVGYTPRHINAAYLEAHPQHRPEIIKAVYNQLYEQWKDFPEGKSLARKVAAEYVNRARLEAAGGVTVPAHVADPHAASNLRDALAQHGVSEKDLDKYMNRISRGGAGHTKSRLDLDLAQEITLADGSKFKLGDAFIKDNVGLFRSYARRVNGDVTLTRRGIHGQMGVNQLRELLVLSQSKGDSKKWANELEAFDQTMAEFMGRPYGNSSAIADNLRILTGASRLGQAVLPQIAETAQLACVLGTESAMRFARDLPRLVSEVRSGKSNPLLHSIELPGGTIGDSHKYVMPWQSYDDVVLAGKEADSALARGIRNAASAQYMLTGHRYLVAAQVRGVSEQILHKVFRYVQSGENDKALQSMGFTPALQKALKRDLKNIASFDEKGALTGLDVRQTTNPAAIHTLKQLVERGANQIIQGNFIGERQAYLHDSWLKVLAQFRSYSLTAMSKQWTRTRVDQGTAKAVGLLMGQMAFALPIHLARVMAVSALMSDDRAKEYRENNLSPEMLGRATLNYATLSGSLGDILDAGAAMAGRPMSGVRSGAQSFSSNVPAIGYVDATARAVKDKDVSGMIKSLPGGNSIFLLPAVNYTHWLQKE